MTWVSDSERGRWVSDSDNTDWILEEGKRRVNG